MASDASSPATARRAHWTGEVVSSFAAMEEHDLEFWLASDPQTRMGAVWHLMEELRQLKGNHGPPPRLCRTLGGVRARRS